MHCRKRCKLRGIIPACAGSTTASCPVVHVARDHPRLRGEYSEATELVKSGSGSSPLARGILRQARSDIQSLRIIPACAGNTRNAAGNGILRQDHPRLRGEYWLSAAFCAVCIGSSPLARGILFVLFYHIFCYLDHPRLRGEYSFSSSSRHRRIGSSPLARGIH